MGKKLTPKARIFVEVYLRTWNASEAAREAGYQQPGQSGYENLRKPEILALIKQRLAEEKVLTSEVLSRTLSQMRGSLADFFEKDENGKWKFSLGQASERNQLHLLKRIEFTEDGALKKIELYSSQDARRDLAEHLGLFKPQKGEEELPEDEGEFSPEKR